MFNLNDGCIVSEESVQTGSYRRIISVSAGIITNNQNQILLSYRPQNGSQDKILHFPGGVFENELEHEGLKRELFKDLGIKVKNTVPFTKIFFVKGNTLIILHALIVECYTGNFSSLDGQFIQWVSLNEYKNVSIAPPHLKIIELLIEHQEKKPSPFALINQHLNIEMLRWSDVRESVSKLNPNLAAAIDEDDVDDEFQLVKAQYNYGDFIMKTGKFSLPLLGGGSVNLKSDYVSSALAHHFSYSLLPMGIILKGAAELCFEHESVFIPMWQFSEGKMIGLINAISENKIDSAAHVMNLYSGMRSVFMLPKISDAHAHARIAKEFNLKMSAPAQYHEHFPVFREIARKSHDQNEPPWQFTILFFTQPWFDAKNKRKKTYHFNRYIEKVASTIVNHHRHKVFLEVFWHIFVNKLYEKHKKPQGHILDSVRQLLSILVGASPGLSGIAHNEQGGPFRLIQQVYLDIYRLSSVPTLIGPSYFDTDRVAHPIYYSLRLPLMLDSVPGSHANDSLITDLVQVQSLYNDFYNMSLSGDLKIEDTIIEHALRRSKVDYFHSNPDENSYYSIYPTSIIPKSDPALLISPSSKPLKFADTSSFIRCCIRLVNQHWQGAE